VRKARQLASGLIAALFIRSCNGCVFRAGNTPIGKKKSKS